MAKELQFYGNPNTQSGYNVTANILDSDGVLVSSDINVQEVSSYALII